MAAKAHGRVGRNAHISNQVRPWIYEYVDVPHITVSPSAGFLAQLIETDLLVGVEGEH